MNLKIIKKEYPRNDIRKTNTVTFTVDGYQLSINIIYLNIDYGNEDNKRKFNAFLDNKLYEQCEQFIVGRYPNINYEHFKLYFMYKLYNYSKGIGLDKSQLKITPEIIKEIEEL